MSPPPRQLSHFTSLLLIAHLHTHAYRCLCAGPYGHDLLSLSEADATVIQESLVNKREILRPGFVRFSTPYYWSDDTVRGVLDALLFVADHGHLFLQDYTFYVDSGEAVFGAQKARVRDGG